VSCPTHPTRTGRLLERARPPGEQAAVARRQQAISNTLEAIHGTILAAIVGSLPLGSVAAIRGALDTRFARFANRFRGTFRDTAYEGAELGRQTTVRRYSLDSRPVFADGGIDDLPERNRVRRELDRGTRRDHARVRARMARDIAEAIYEASQAGLERDTIRDRMAGRFDDVRGYEVRRIASAELSTGIGRGSLSAFEDDSDADTITWKTQLDASVRASHRALQDVSTPLGEPFIVGPSQSPARYPGDWRLPQSERLGCRCYLRLS
jgi:hypothetical protein